MTSLILWSLGLGCTGEEPTYDDITSRDEVDIVDEPSNEPSEETAVVDTADTAETIEVSDTITFRAPLIPCNELRKRTMTLTRMFPGGLDIAESSEAEFFNEVLRLPLGSSGFTFSQTEDLNDCIFSVDLPIPDESDLQEVMLQEEGEQTPIGVQWAFYYPATFVHQDVDCQTPSLTETNTQKVSCISTYTTPLTQEPEGMAVDAPVISGDLYDWGSDVLPVYVQGDIQGAFGDLGFELGWNLAQFSEGEIVLVEPMGALDQLQQIIIDNRVFLPRYNINSRGSTSAEADFGNTYSIDLMPAHWLNGVTTVETGVSMYIQDSAVSWSFEVWGIPETTQFFGASFPSDNPIYEQWGSSVDVAAFVPLVFGGEPSSYSSGVPVQGDDLSATDPRLGAVCKDSATLAFTFWREARRPSEVYWYSLMGLAPGWYAQYGTNGDPSTWRMVLENTDAATPYNYVSLAIGNSCQVPAGWQ